MEIDTAYKRSKLLCGDLLLSIRGSVGDVTKIPPNLDGANITQDTARLRIKDTYTSNFLIHALKGSSVNRQIKLNTIGQAVKGVNIAEVRRLIVPLPPLPEQKKIAEILSAWDEAIEQTRNLINAKKLLKKALMQQLLNGRRRFHAYDRDEWRVRPLGELVEPVSRPVPKPREPYLSIGVRSHGKGTFQKIVELPEKVVMDTLYRVESNDLIVNITFAWEGAIAITTERDKGGLVSHRFPTYRLKEKEADIDFLQNLIVTKRFVWDLGLISPGGAGRNRVLNQKDFLKLNVFVPSVEVQEEIGKRLTAADNELRLCEGYQNSLEKQKRGLMQKLLTGEVRVKT
ncbi:MAG: restriction endonuclease subunit S [Candidatus Hydrogenedentota bacterium]|nr:MAG: restriction endonuclease subunit S [Candidatus Hydrogenedentota bacterium]